MSTGQPHAYGAGEQHRPGEPRFGGMHVPEPEFADDDGAQHPEVAASLAAWQSGQGSERGVAAALDGRRLMVPLVAVLDSVEEREGAPGPGEKDSHMATVSLVGQDGRRGLLAFTSVQAMAAWDPQARGIPASAQRVAAAALEEGADAVLLDLGGPVRFALQGAALRRIADGTGIGPLHRDPDVAAAVAACLDGLAGVRGHELAQAPPDAGVPLLVVVQPVPGVDADAVAAEAAARLAGGSDAARRLADLVPEGLGLGLDPA
ncbi:MAG: SseB family protein [Candidatus Nanopelagicales bacterium]